MKDLRSPLAKAKGLGGSPEASSHFWLQRLTALALIPLTLWFCFSLAMLPHASYVGVVAWLQLPFNAVMMLLIVVLSFQHGQLGLQVIIEDYIAAYPYRIACLFGVKVVSYFMMAVGVYSILKISLGGS
ncbi:MAG: succinate dehydrogenase, hydrophobic membrane anchor protein [Cocleimonas sp.]|nr:succinate dehydrogenase, hydrophobic membrane anchor protein [Cocleimonas sp.]